MSAMTVWREYDLGPGAPNYEGIEVLQNIHSTWMWGAHLDVRTHPCVQTTLRACSGHESLTGEYLLESSWHEWGDPPEDPVPPDDPMHLLVYFTAPSILAAVKVGCELARRVIPIDASATMVVSTAGAWSETIGLWSLREPRGFHRKNW